MRDSALDIGLTVAAFVGAFYIRKDLFPSPFGILTGKLNYYIVLLMIVIIRYLSFAILNLYESYRRPTFNRILTHFRSNQL